MPIEFTDRNEAKNWIIRNQIGKRNLTTESRDYLLGKLYKEQKKERGGNHGNQFTQEAIDHFDLLPTTAQRIADQFKVSEPTVKHDETDGLAVAYGA